MALIGTYIHRILVIDGYSYFRVYVVYINFDSCFLHFEIALFPGLPCFYLPLTFTIIHSSEKQGRPGLIHNMSGHEVEVGGEGLIF